MSDVSGIDWNEEPLISCIMPTFGRPRYVPEAVQCFLEQDYSRKELIVLNDCPGQELRCDIPGVKVFNVPQRFGSLGEKRNAAIELAEGEILAVWDDDDLFLPWRLSLTWEEMRRYRTPFYRPAEFLAYWGEERLHDNQSIPGWVSHSTAAFTRELWRSAGQYPAMNVGEDAAFFKAIHEHLGEEFIKQPIAATDRFYILRGRSDYHHMSIGGGRDPLDVTPGVYQIEPQEVADSILRQAVRRAVVAQGIHCPEITPGTAASCSTPQLSVCIALKNRSRIIDEDRCLDLFPRCVRSLSDAAREFGSLELVVADFESDDRPLREWLHGAGNLTVTVVPMAGAFSRGRGLNAAVRAASSSNLFLSDADVLVSADALRRGVERIQAGTARFTICQDLNRDGSPGNWRDAGKGLVFLSRAHFEQSGGVPEFNSWGGEDDLHLDCIRKFARVEHVRDPEVLHQWHPEWCRHVNYRRGAWWDFWSRRTSEVAAAEPRLVAEFEGRHPYWNGGESRIRLFDDGRLERPGMDTGSFEWRREDQIILRWDRWPAEVLNWDPANRWYRDISKNFTLQQVERPSDIVQSLRDDCAELSEHLRSLAPFQYFDCGGNRGDLVIHSGTRSLFRAIGVEYSEIHSPNDVNPRQPVVLSGSGGFCRFWNTAPRAAAELASRTGEMVVLPSSFEASALKSLREHRNVFLYAREHESLAEAETAGRFPVRFCPDLAVWVDLPDPGPPVERHGVVFRTDHEGFQLGARHPENRDLSVLGSPTAQDFIREVGRFESVSTDRTHVAMVAAMLGREVRFYPNRYHKNRAFFDAYLRRFNCSWHEIGESEVARIAAAAVNSGAR